MYDSVIESRKMGRGEWQKSVLSPDDAAIADSNSPVVKARKSATSLPCLPSSGCNRSPSVSPSNISSFLSGRLARRQARTASYPLTLPLPSRSNSFLAKTFRTDSYLVRFFLPLFIVLRFSYLLDLHKARLLPPQTFHHSCINLSESKSTDG